MHFGFRQVMPSLGTYQVGKKEGSRSADFCSWNRMCCFLMNLPTTSMLNLYFGLSSIYSNIKELLSQSPTIGISLTTLQDGFWNLIGEKVFHGKGNYSSWLDQKQNRLKQEEKTESKRQKTLERELEWIRMTPKARQAKGKARLSAYDKLISEEGKEKEAKLELYIPPGPRLGAKVIEVNGVSKAYGDKLLFDDLSFNLPQGGIVGIIGPNGAGKSTLFKLITGQEKADAGYFEVGETVKLAYVDQEHDRLDPNKSVYETISGGNEIIKLGNKEMNARAYVGKFNFAGSDQEKKVGILSGGERNRVHLAITLKEGGNLLLLDEPTNDLDVNTLEST
jgi:energy-dependent translational throttle protein EttA